MASAVVPAQRRGLLAQLNGRYHKIALNTFMVVVLAHWTEHVAQAIQVWGLDWPRPKAKGLLGYAFPWLITTEWLHYGFALVMLVALWTLRSGFTGAARRWWTLALIIQFWHHIEHFLLLVQAQIHHYMWGAKVPTSIVQHWFPRIELHLFYNSIVTVPMLIAVVLHMLPRKDGQHADSCTCSVHSSRELTRAA